MNRAARSALVLLAAVSMSGAKRADPPPVEPAAEAQSLQESFVRVAAVARPAVVSITSVHEEDVRPPVEFFFGDPFNEFFEDHFGQNLPRPRPGRPAPRRYEGMGSGVIVRPEGYILTNEHVVHGATDLKVTLLEPEEKTYTGKVVGSDPRTDLAVVKIQAKSPLPFLALADSDEVRVGDWAVAVGSPFGLEQTVTVGVISAVRQSLNIDGRDYGGLLQTDAAINRGNSGGPLLNLRGEVVGVNTAIYAPTGVFSGVGFAIPSRQAREIMEQLIEKGRVVRGWMGVEIVALDDVLVKQFSVPDKKGVLVNHVVPGSPAEKAGIRRGDVIRRFAGREVADQDALIAAVGKTPPQTKTAVELLRAGKTMEVALVTGEMPDDPDAPFETPAGGERATGSPAEWGGAQWTPNGAGPARRYGLPPDAGAVAVRVGAGFAADIGLMEGDLVVSVNKAPTPDLKSFLAAAKKAEADGEILVDLNRRGRWLYISHRKEGE